MRQCQNDRDQLKLRLSAAERSKALAVEEAVRAAEGQLTHELNDVREELRRAREAQTETKVRNEL